MADNLKKLKPISRAAAEREARLVFDRFTSNDFLQKNKDRHESDGSSPANDKKICGCRRGKVEEDTNNNALKKFKQKVRSSFSRRKSSVKGVNKENDDCSPESIKNGSIKYSDSRGTVKYDGVPSTTNPSKTNPSKTNPSKTNTKLPHNGNTVSTGASNPSNPNLPLRIFPPPPPPPPVPTYAGEDSDLVFDGLTNNNYLVDNEDDDYDVTDGDHFEDVTPEERQRRIEEVTKMLDDIASNLGAVGPDPMKRSPSTSSLANVAFTFVKELSYTTFKRNLSEVIRSHNDTLLNQIVLLFSVTRSAVNSVGKDSSRGREISDNALKYYDEQFAVKVAKAGGIEGLVASSTSTDERDR